MNFFIRYADLIYAVIASIATREIFVRFGFFSGITAVFLFCTLYMLILIFISSLGDDGDDDGGGWNGPDDDFDPWNPDCGPDLDVILNEYTIEEGVKASAER